jgi:hypothetical protein
VRSLVGEEYVSRDRGLEVLGSVTGLTVWVEGVSMRRGVNVVKWVGNACLSFRDCALGLWESSGWVFERELLGRCEDALNVNVYCCCFQMPHRSIPTYRVTEGNLRPL